jgi:hypothetical protein
VIVWRYANTTSVASSKACCSAADSDEVGEGRALGSAPADALGGALGLVAGDSAGALEQPVRRIPAAKVPARVRVVRRIMSVLVELKGPETL